MTPVGRAGVGLVAATLGALGLGFLGFAATLTTVEAPPVRHADGLVVLTGGTDRLADAITLLADGRADRLLITGVNPSVSPSELARRMPKLRARIDCCVTLGYRALDTAGNAQETAQWVSAHDIRSLIVVTSNYHMPRALAEIRHQVRGVDLLAYPVVADSARDAPWWSSLQRVRIIASEYLKYIVVMARHAVLPHTISEGPTVVAQGSALH